MSQNFGTDLRCDLVSGAGVLQGADLHAWTPAQYQFEAWGEDSSGAMFCCELIVAGEVDYSFKGTSLSDSIELTNGVGGSLKYGRAVITADNGDDALNGSNDSSCVDYIYGEGGNDIIKCQAMRDVLYGGTGSDIVFGEDGDDFIYGEDGDDEIYGGNGNDGMYGGLGHDSMKGGSGNDLMYGYDGSDLMCGNSGDDEMHGEDGNDYVIGGAGVNILSGDGGVDTCNPGFVCENFDVICPW